MLSVVLKQEIKGTAAGRRDRHHQQQQQQQRPEAGEKRAKNAGGPHSPAPASPLSHNGSSAAAAASKKRYIWSDRETEHFIRLIIDMGMTNMLDSKRKRNSDLYSSLVQPMAAAGFNRDATQLRTKWKHLKQDYKVELVRIEKNGAASSRMSYFHLLHEVLSCKPSNAMTYLCEVVSNSPPRNQNAENGLVTVKTEYDDREYEDDDNDYPGNEVKMDTADFYANEPQVDIIQISDGQTQTDPVPDPNRKISQRLQTLEHGIVSLRDEWRRDSEVRHRQYDLLDRRLRKILENQKKLMDDFLGRTAGKNG